MCTALAQGCGSSGMVLAMHHIQVACVARHALGSPFFRDYMRHVAEKQLLLASVTSEVGVWGDTRFQHLRPGARGGPLQAREGRDDALVRRSRRRPPRDLSPQSRSPGERPDPRASPQGGLHADQDRELGHARPARHVQPRLQGELDRIRRSGHPGIVRGRIGADDGVVLAHPLVGRVARHRDRRLHPRQRLRESRGSKDPRNDPPQSVASRQARGVAPGHAQSRDCASRGLRRDHEAADRNGRASHDRVGAQDEQRQGRRVRGCAQDRPRGAPDHRHHRLQERLEVLRRSPVPRLPLGGPDDLRTTASIRRTLRCSSSTRTSRSEANGARRTERADSGDIR